MVISRKYHLLLLSLVFGLLMAAAWPERGWSLLAFIAWVPLLYLQDHIYKNPQFFSRSAVVLYSYPGFLVWNVLTTWWIYNSTVIGSILAFVLNSFFMALVFGLFHFVRKNVFTKGKGYFSLIALWITFEYLHQEWDLTWSWLNLGNVFASSYKWIQWYEFTGTFGGSVWVLGVNILIWNALKKMINGDYGWKKLSVKLISPMILILLPVSISIWMYRSWHEKGIEAEIVVVQPDIDPYNEEYTIPVQNLLNNMLSLARQKTDENTDMVLFPESSIAYTIYESDFSLTQIYDSVTDFIENTGAEVVLGLSSRKIVQPGSELDKAARPLVDNSGYYVSYNTAAHINKYNQIEYYHKAKLVPGVERMPFPSIFKYLDKFAIDLGGATGSLGTSKKRAVFIQGKVHLGPIICYESIYGEFVSGYVREGANLLGIITNDGWWGNSPGHRQHFEYARLRAIENRRDIARSANNGISGFFNQRGDDSQKTDYWMPDVRKATVNLNEEKTFYVVYGDYIARFSGFVAALLLLMGISLGLKKRRIKE